MRRILSLAFLAFLLVVVQVLATGCGNAGITGSGGSGGAGGDDPQTGSIILGVTSDLRVDVDVNRLHVVMHVDGKVVRDEVFGDSKAAPLAFPLELPFLGLADASKIEADFELFRVGDTVKPLVNRSVASMIRKGKKLLLRVMLDSRCAVAPGSNAPVCDAPKTCIAGVCTTAQINSQTLTAYTANWAKASTDICKPEGAGAPVLTVGAGQSDYLPTQDGAVAQVEAGPQGGHHVWIAIRMKNLLQSGSITQVTGHFDDPMLDVGPYQVIFTFDQDEGGYCKLYGLRFQIDQDPTIPIDQLLGKTVTVTVTVSDKDGDVGVGTRVIKLSDTFI